MKPKILFNLLTVLGLALVLITVLFTGTYLAGQANAQEGGITAQGTVGTAFTYQGRLNNGSNPADGIYDFVFLLFDVESGSSELAIHNVPDQDVNDGYFSVQLDFGSSAFTGQERWLEIRVKADSETSYTTLTPRVNLLPTPYAQSLRPGAVISGNAMSTFSVMNSFEAALFPASAILGYATGESGENYGVFGLSDSDNGVGVYGEATSQGYGVYSRGDAHVEGDLTWKSKSSYVSVPAAAFIPRASYYDYTNEGWIVAGSSGGKFYAPVQLPHEAELIGMTFYYYDDTWTGTITCTLYVDAMGSSPTQEALVQIPSTSNSGSSYDSKLISSTYSTVNNYERIYYLEWDMDSSSTKGRGVVIQYRITQPY